MLFKNKKLKNLVAAMMLGGPICLLSVSDSIRAEDKVEAGKASITKIENGSADDAIFDSMLSDNELTVKTVSKRDCSPCPPGYVPYCPPAQTPACPPETTNQQLDSQMNQLRNDNTNYLNQNTTNQNSMSQNRPNVNFNRNADSLLASRDVPAMIGDFFGGGAFSVCVPVITEPNQVILARSATPAFLALDRFDSSNRGIFDNAPMDINGDNTAEPGLSIQFISQNPLVNNTGNTVPGPYASLVDDEGFSQISTQVLNVNGTPINANNTFTYNNNTYVFIEGLATLDQAGYPLIPSSVMAVDNKDNLYTPRDRTTPQAQAQSGNYKGNYDAYIFSATIAPVNITNIYIPISATAGRVKLSENSSPTPHDRLFFNYNYFSNVGLLPGGLNVNRFTPGFEKTFMDGNMSAEIRVPVAMTVDSDIRLGATTGTTSPVTSSLNNPELGDVTTTLKSLLLRTDTFSISCGSGLSFPTANAITVNLPNGQTVLKVKNEAYHLMPYIGGTYTPSDRFFSQGIVQYDHALSANSVLFNSDPNNFTGQSGLQKIGKLQFPDFLYMDFSAGYWMYRANRNEMLTKQGITGFAPIMEFHHNFSLQDFDQVSSPIFGSNKSFILGDNAQGFNQTNLILGCVTEINADASLSMGYVIPVSKDPIFDGEFRCNFNYNFGGSARRNDKSYTYGNRSI